MLSMNIPEQLIDVLVSDPEFVSGTVRFKGTRVPLQALLETLEEGGTVQDFLSDYPGVLPAQAKAVITFLESDRRAVLYQDLPNRAQ
jgi:uncharacterized protein (DUF433 family)